MTVGFPRTTGVSARWSNNRTPVPSNTAARSIWISSSSPASRHCWIVSAPCTPTDFEPAADFAWATALSMPSVTNWTVEPGRGQPSGTWCVTTKAGTSHGCCPSQPPATSNVRRPVSMAPISAANPFRCAALGAETRNVMSDVALAVGTSMSPEKYQSKTSATPSFASATYPSSDIDMSATTLAMDELLSRQHRSMVSNGHRFITLGRTTLLRTRPATPGHRIPGPRLEEPRTLSKGYLCGASTHSVGAI